MWTFIRPGTQPGMLYEMIQQLPYREQGERPLIKIHVFSTRDGSMVRRVWLTHSLVEPVLGFSQFAYLLSSSQT
jgi:hypothetical protein